MPPFCGWLPRRSGWSVSARAAGPSSGGGYFIEIFPIPFLLFCGALFFLFYNTTLLQICKYFFYILSVLFLDISKERSKKYRSHRFRISKQSLLPEILRGLRGWLCGSGFVDTGLGQDINFAEPEALAASCGLAIASFSLSIFQPPIISLRAFHSFAACPCATKGVSCQSFTQTAPPLAPQLEQATQYLPPLSLRILAEPPQNGQGFNSKFTISIPPPSKLRTASALASSE